ncbi:lipid A phosphoethanolamine transferase [Flavobacterium pectinovorum]|uniref:Lipid A phosphoethanolamine transferase n=1 Tax=Flavobacterium pectinovorum TaxID=29533 RepID=A0A502F3Q6_9FLAO|nr:lipid A phosphoethanolamine transferase [Flavobacterium pectinovorum]TPG44022.1 lipid A phosphoethanolamine transferase [Flavobacterium pectinovorum]
MKKLQLFFWIFFLFTLSIKAQDTAETNSPFSEARYNYFLKTILLFNEYLDTDTGSFNTTQLRILHPIGNKAWNLRLDVPLISTNTSSINKTGFGDVGVGVSYIPFFKKNKGVAFRARVVSNSAVDPSLGSGKWVFIPTVFYGKYFKGKQFLWISSLEYQTSFAGSSNRNDISVTAFENVVLWFFGKNWIATDAAFRYNSRLDGFQNNAFLEFGRKITPVNLVYIHPSVAFGGEKTYNYGLEAGVLILF